MFLERLSNSAEAESIELIIIERELLWVDARDDANTVIVCPLALDFLFCRVQSI